MPVKKSPALIGALRERIESGEWAAGEFIPNERSLAESYGVARNTVRKTLDEFEKEGLILRQVGRGTMVVEKPDAQFADILDRFLDASPLDILNLRLYIEPFSAEAAARNATESEMEAIAEAETKCMEATDLAKYEYWDGQFHRLIYQAAHNTFLSDCFDLLAIIRHQAPMLELRRRAFTEQRRQAYGQEHSDIVTALKNWDGKAAAKAMRSHLLSRRQNYFGQ